MITLETKSYVGADWISPENLPAMVVKLAQLAVFDARMRIPLAEALVKCGLSEVARWVMIDQFVGDGLHSCHLATTTTVSVALGALVGDHYDWYHTAHIRDWHVELHEFITKPADQGGDMEELTGHPNWKPHERLSVEIAQLAAAMVNGEDCGFALHDALLENPEGSLPLCAKGILNDVQPTGLLNEKKGTTNSLLLGILVGDGYERWHDDDEAYDWFVRFESNRSWLEEIRHFLYGPRKMCLVGALVKQYIGGMNDSTNLEESPVTAHSQREQEMGSSEAEDLSAVDAERGL